MKRYMVVFFVFCGIGASCFMNNAVSEAQIGFFTKEEVIEYTPLWKGERSPDGRPKVSDDILERMKKVSLEEARSVVRRHGYINQLELDFLITNENKVLVGRAHTSQFMPNRPDLLEVMRAKGEKAGAYGSRPKFWQIDMLVKGDVPVVDMFGKKTETAYVGDNLANRVHEKTGTGIVVDGGCRDYDGIIEIPDFIVYNRSFNPTSSGTTTICVSINSPILIGQAVVLPGDVVLGRHEGVIFIPPHIAEEVVETSEVVRLRDEFRFGLLRSGKYQTREVYSRWNDDVEVLFMDWVKKKGITFSPLQLELIKKGWTWL